MLVSFPISLPLIPTALMQQAMEEAIDCWAAALLRMADKAEIPKPSRLKRGQKIVPVPLDVGKLALTGRFGNLR